MNDKIRNLDAKWQEELKTFAYNQKYKTITEKKEYWDKESSDYDVRMYQDLRRVTDVVDILKTKNTLTGNEDILEVGCGTGLYSLALAPWCKKITAIDLSEKMGEVLLKNAKEKSIDNIEFKADDWSEFDVSNNKFNVVLSALNPAINGYSALVKLMEASKKYCCVVVFSANPQNSVREYLGKDQNIIKKQDDIYICEMLEEMGYFPQAFGTEMKWVKENKKEDAKVRLFNEYKNLYENKNELENLIDLFVEKNSDDDGYFREHNKSELAIIFWEVKKWTKI